MAAPESPGSGTPAPDRVFKAIADPVRRLILEELLEQEGQTLFELTTRLLMRHRLGITRQGISKHLATLETAGLLRVERAGRYVRHYLETRPLRDLEQGWLDRFTKGGI